MDNKCLVIPQYGCSVADLYHRERNHQGKGNKLLFPDAADKTEERGHAVECRQRLGGLLKFYARAA
jgi:putative transposase